MNISQFGAIQISITPRSDNPEIMLLDIAVENRKEPMHMETRRGETIDQFVTRIRSILRALVNTEPRQAVGDIAKAKASAEPAKVKTWEEQKAELAKK